jgi:hypothetical protein
MMSLAIVIQRAAGSTWIRGVVAAVSTACRLINPRIPIELLELIHIFKSERPGAVLHSPPAPMRPETSWRGTPN